MVMDAAQYVLGVVILATAVAVSIGLHEVGHMVPAKKFGVRVTEYMIGFGPTLWSTRKGETEYGIKALPLGGYIRMIGMYPPRPGQGSRSTSTGLFSSMIENARAIEAEAREPGDENRSFYRLRVWQKLTIMLGGPVVNLLIGAVLLSVLVLSIGSPSSAAPTTTVGTVYECVVPVGSGKTACETDDPPSPAAAAGLKPGDQIVAVGGKPLSGWEELREIIRQSAGQPVLLGVHRGEENLKLTLTPALTAVPKVDGDKVARLDDGTIATEEVGFAGLTPRRDAQPGTVGDAAVFVGTTLYQTGHAILGLPQRLVDVAQAAFSSAPRDPNGPIGIVGLGRISGEVSSIDEFTMKDRVAMMLGLVGSLNIFLFVFNLIPLLPFDGGHVAGALWEGIRRFVAKLRGAQDPGPVDVAKGAPLVYAVASILLLMSALLLYADLVKPITLRG